jgi:hypothetical protein
VPAPGRDSVILDGEIVERDACFCDMEPPSLAELAPADEERLLGGAGRYLVSQEA